MGKMLTLLVLRLLMNLLLISWISLWIIKPTTVWIQSWRQAEDTFKHTFFGYYGLSFAVFSFPPIALSIIGLIYLSLLPQHHRLTRGGRSAAITVSRPAIINSFIGIVSCFEIIAVILFLVFLAWTFYVRVNNDLKKLMPVKTINLDLWQLKYFRVATRFGLLAEACLSLLLFPVLRGLSMFRLLNIQFAASVKYHVWLGTGLVFFLWFMVEALCSYGVLVITSKKRTGLEMAENGSSICGWRDQSCNRIADVDHITSTNS
ncbi:ferric reduction oxidase 8, mitochondrial isoform X1 [Brassica napus]|uniref:ferric reduction oxidase 8, mitochondrial isoform X1 n=1 Tax=Brassica napus TaxID=3708 RepID=UPI0020785CBB|nr:ferric reduction oxidase 8, mitochondrial isoform X1 [Brassica napus]